MDPVQFDQLPYLCLKKIFSFLNLRDLTTCRAVSRQFKAYAEEIGVDQLVVNVKGTRCKIWCQSWYQTGRPIDYKCSISPKAFASSLESSPFKLDQQLKFLHLHLNYLIIRSDISLEILSEFKQLRHLELRGVGGSRTLIQPNLKVLDVLSYPNASYVLKTPKLEVLMCRNISSIQAEHPETIKKIECDCEPGDPMTGLASFENLQILICNRIGGRVPDGIRLSNWRHLKELQIRSKSSVRFKDFQSSLVNLMRQRTESKREDLKLYVDEVLLVDAKQLEDHRAGRNLFRMKYYRLLRCDTYPDVTYVHFNELMKLNVELSSDFFDRFPRIQRLAACGPVDRDRFEWFLQNAPAVRELSLQDTSLDSAFMNRLPQINNRLTRLKVNESPGLTADLNFVLQFKQLTEFLTDCELDSLDFPAKAFRRLNKLQSFFFRASSTKYVHIGRDSLKNDYFLEISSVIFQKNLDWAQLVALYDQRSTLVSSEDNARLQ